MDNSWQFVLKKMHIYSGYLLNLRLPFITETFPEMVDIVSSLFPKLLPAGNPIRNLAVGPVWVRCRFAVGSLQVRFRRRTKSDSRETLQGNHINPKNAPCYSCYSATVPFHPLPTPESAVPNCSNCSAATLQSCLSLMILSLFVLERLTVS